MQLQQNMQKKPMPELTRVYKTFPKNMHFHIFGFPSSL